MSFFALKTVALLSMLWDHVTYVWPLALTLEVFFFPDAAEAVPALLVLQRATDYIGRIAAPPSPTATDTPGILTDTPCGF
jgi:hypothetical protein